MVKKKTVDKVEPSLGRKSDDIYNYKDNSVFNASTIRDFKQSYKHINECLEIAPVLDSLEFISSLISQQPFIIHGGSDEINAFVKDNLDNLPLNIIIENCLYSLLYGYSVQEIIWALNDDNRIIISDVVPIAQSTLDSGLLNIVYSGNVIAGFKQLTNMTYLNNNSNPGEIFIPIEKTIYSVYKPKMGNPLGNSILRSINFEIQMYKEVYENLRLFAYRLSIPVTVVTTDLTNRDEVKNLVHSVKSNMEHPKGAILLQEGTEISKLDRGSNVSKIEEYLTTIDHLSNVIYSRFGIANIMRHDPYGSSAKQTVDMNLTLNIVNEYVEIINDLITTLINKLVQYNYPNPDKIKFTLNQIKSINWNSLYDILNNAGMDSKSEIYRDILDQVILDYTDVEYRVDKTDIIEQPAQKYHSTDGYSGNSDSVDPNGEDTKKMLNNL
jgi:hypothetical protein